MPLEPYTGNADAAHDSRNLRIHKWISTLPGDLSKHHHADSIGGRSDSPLLGFTSQESASNDPLHRPSANYVRWLPEEVVLTNKRTQQDKSLTPQPSELRVPSLVPEDVEKDNGILSPVMRSPPNGSATRFLTHLSYIQGRRPIPRHPSLPVFGSTSYHHQTFGPSVMPRTRSYSTAATLRSDSSALPASQTLQVFTAPTTRAPPPSPMASVINLSSALERQKLNALVIASGLAAEEELQADGLGHQANSSQVYLGEPVACQTDSPVDVASPITLHPSTRDGDARNSSITTHYSQTISSPRTSTSLADLDEFDEDASYYGKDIDSLFSPYSCPARRVDDADQPAASKWSLSSSIDLDLNTSRRNSPTKSLKNKREKFRSFISRFAPNPPPSLTDKPTALTTDRSSEKIIRRLRSHSDALASIAEHNRPSSRTAITHGSWESVPPTPTTATSFTSMSVSTSYSPATPSDHENDPRDTPIGTHLFRASDEKLASSAGLSRIESPTLETSSSSLTSGPNTSVPNSPVDAAPHRPPLRHAVSTASLKMNSLKGLASIIGLAPADSLHEETPNVQKKTSEAPRPPTPQPPRTFKERMMLKNNGSALSLILGKSNKHSKPKRKLLISGVEKDNHSKYEAISTWCESFGKVNVKQVANGAIIADFNDAKVADTVCRLQARVYIKGAGSVNLSWTTNEISSLSAAV